MKPPLEARLVSLEEKVDEISKALMHLEKPSKLDRLALIAGSFSNDPEYEEAMTLGREYRESFRPVDYDGDS